MIKHFYLTTYTMLLMYFSILYLHLLIQYDFSDYRRAKLPSDVEQSLRNFLRLAQMTGERLKYVILSTFVINYPLLNSRGF